MPRRKPEAVFLDVVPVFKPGDPPPSGYAEWFEWADVQRRAGLKQTRCRFCGLWFYPSETHDFMTCSEHVETPHTKGGRT